MFSVYWRRKIGKRTFGGRGSGNMLLAFVLLMLVVEASITLDGFYKTPSDLRVKRLGLLNELKWPLIMRHDLAGSATPMAYWRRFILLYSKPRGGWCGKTISPPL